MKINSFRKYLYLGIVISCLSLLLFSCSVNETKEVNYNIDDYTIDVPYKENFQILQLTDTHWLGNSDWTTHKSFIQKVINNSEIPNEKPDFIIITGDCVNDSNINDWKNYCDFFDSFQIPWTLTFGNHDARAEFSMNDLTSFLNERSNSQNSYLKFKNNINDDIYGDANFAINLTQNNNIIEQLIIMDSNRYRNTTSDDSGYSGYDYIHPDQVEWYKNLINKTKEKNSGVTVPSLAFFHIPLQEHLFAWELVQKGEANFLDEGKNNEEVCCPNENTGLFDAMKELNSTKGVFCGHDHVNYSIINYQGIKLAYGLKSSNYIYHDEDKLGGRLISLQNNGDFSSKLIKQSY